MKTGSCVQNAEFGDAGIVEEVGLLGEFLEADERKLHLRRN